MLGLQCPVQHLLAKYIMILPDLPSSSGGWVVFQYPSLGEQADVNIFILQMEEVVHLRLQAQEPVSGGKVRTGEFLVLHAVHSKTSFSKKIFRSTNINYDYNHVTFFVQYIFTGRQGILEE